MSNAFNNAIKLAKTISVTDFGAVGDGTTDDTAAIQAAIDDLISQGGGTLNFPAGAFKVTTLVGEVAGDICPPVRFVGQGGYPGEGTTRLIFSPSSAGNGLVLKSAQQWEFNGIEFICGNSNIQRLIYVTTQESPVFSSFHNVFKRCSFRPFTGSTPSVNLIVLAGGVLTEFEGCWFAGSDQTIRLGEDLPLTESGGGAGLTLFSRCEIYHDIEVLDAQNTTFLNCVFGRKNLTDLIEIYPAASGFVRHDFDTFIGCSQVLNISGDDQTFWTQGAASNGLVALNNRFTGYKTVFTFTGEGRALLAGNWYQPPTATTGCVAITIGANARDVDYSKDDFSLFQSGGFVAVDDNRTIVRKPLVVDEVVGTDYTFASVGSFETVMTSSVQLRGGMYRMRWALNITNTAAVSDFTIRPTVNGTSVQKGCAFHRIAASATELISGECLVAIDGTTAAVDVALTCRQGAGAAATVKADSVSYSSFFQLEEI